LLFFEIRLFWRFILFESLLLLEWSGSREKLITNTGKYRNQMMRISSDRLNLGKIRVLGHGIDLKYFDKNG
jgi:hypothetical protein